MKKINGANLKEFQAYIEEYTSIIYPELPLSVKEYLLNAKNQMIDETLDYRHLWFLWNLPTPSLFLPKSYTRTDGCAPLRRQREQIPKKTRNIETSQDHSINYEKNITEITSKTNYSDYIGTKTKGSLLRANSALAAALKTINNDKFYEKWLLSRRLADSNPQDDIFPSLPVENLELRNNLTNSGLRSSDIRKLMINLKNVVIDTFNKSLIDFGGGKGGVSIEIDNESQKYKVATLDCSYL